MRRLSVRCDIGVIFVAAAAYWYDQPVLAAFFLGWFIRSFEFKHLAAANN